MIMNFVSIYKVIVLLLHGSINFFFISTSFVLWYFLLVVLPMEIDEMSIAMEIPSEI